MAGAGTQVDIAGMLAAQPHFEEALKDTTSAYNTVSEQARVLESTWTGDAAAAFIPALNQWLESCNKVRAQLNIVYEKLEANTGHYEQVHSSTVDAATAIRQAMSAGLPGF